MRGSTRQTGDKNRCSRRKVLKVPRADCELRTRTLADSNTRLRPASFRSYAFALCSPECEIHVSNFKGTCKNHTGDA